MKKKGNGKISAIFNNYGIVTTSSFNANGDSEDIPFAFTKDMVTEEFGETYIEYYDEITFTLENIDGIRRQGRTLELKNIQGIGQKKKKLRNFPSEKYVDKVLSKFKEFNMDISQFENLSDIEIYEKLKSMNFQPRMLNYLVDGIFLKRSVLECFIFSNPNNVSLDYFKLSPQSIVIVDKIDQKFRLYLLEWILQIENSIKAYISRISSDKDAALILSRVMQVWKTKKGTRHIERARKSKLFRRESDTFDYVLNEFVPIEDILDQLDLIELKEFIQYWYEESTKGPEIFISPTLEQINATLKFFVDLSILRNSAAHGRSVLAGFMDPDYNPNWDLEFDDVDRRTKVKDWALYPILEKYWKNQSTDEKCIPHKIQTIYGNSYRKAWVTLNYIYMTLMPVLDIQQFKIFVDQAQSFLKYPDLDEIYYNELRSLNLLDLKLWHMGSTTLEQITGISAPYREIANEALSVWESCQSH
ncbi:MAG: Abi family protein [Streptococcus sp.]|nr:Abi family protein [Streptococcus sp.]